MDAPGPHEAEPLARDVRGAEEQVRQIAEEQAALRRVAVLVASGEPPEAVFAAVAEEAGRVVPAADFAVVGRYGAPISVEGRLWGVMIVASGREDALTAGTEHRLAGFAELIAIAIANAQARVELRGFAEEQAALRRVATLVARAASAQEVFAAVAEEAGRVLGTDLARMNRYDPDGGHTVIAGWASTGDTMPVPLGSRCRAPAQYLAAG